MTAGQHVFVQSSAGANSRMVLQDQNQEAILLTGALILLTHNMQDQFYSVILITGHC